MLSKDKIDSQALEQKNSGVILPEELLLNSLLLFEDELAEEEIAGLPAKEDGSEPAAPEMTGSSDPSAPSGTAADSKLEISKAILELEKEEAENYYQKVKKELADYLKERQVIVEKIRNEQLLLKSKSAKPKRCAAPATIKTGNLNWADTSRPEKPEKKEKINLESFAQTKNSTLKNFLKRETVYKSTLPKENNLRNPSLKENRNNSISIDKNRKTENYSKAKKFFTINNKTGPGSKSKKGSEKQRIKIRRQNSLITVSLRNNGLKVNDSPANKADHHSPRCLNKFRDLAEKSKAIAIKKNTAKTHPINLLDQASGQAFALRELSLNRLKPNSEKNPRLNQSKQFKQLSQFFNGRVKGNSEDCFQGRDKENKLSLKEMEKTDLRFKQLSLSGEKRNSACLFKL